MKKFSPASFILLAALLCGAPRAGDAAPSKSVAGFNLFSVEQDVEIGRQSAVEAERQLTLLQDRNLDRYLSRIVKKLADQAPGADYPYTIKAVNEPDVNAFALPGGPMYVNRGLIEAARSEAELAGVLSHEMAHVALRHGTHQASKAYLAKGGIGILGGLLGRNGGNASKIVSAVGGLGLNAAFLKFGRDDEYQADRVGAEIMAAAGYAPAAMADFFELLRTQQGRDPGKLETFMSNHPASADREARIRAQAGNMRTARARDVGSFDRVRTDLRRHAPAAEVARGRVDVGMHQASNRVRSFTQRSGLFTIEHPDNWRAFAPVSGYAVSFSPEGGVVETDNDHQAMIYGVIVNHYAPFEGDSDRHQGSLERHYAPFEDSDRWRGSLEDATDDLVRQTIRSNPYLRAEDGTARREQIDGAASFSVLLTGRSPVTGQDERITVVTRGMSDGHVIYALCIVPAREHEAMDRTFTQMLRSLRVNDDAAHRGKHASKSDSRR